MGGSPRKILLIRYVFIEGTWCYYSVHSWKEGLENEMSFIIIYEIWTPSTDRSAATESNQLASSCSPYIYIYINIFIYFAFLATGSIAITNSCRGSVRHGKSRVRSADGHVAAFPRQRRQLGDAAHGRGYWHREFVTALHSASLIGYLSQVLTTWLHVFVFASKPSAVLYVILTLTVISEMAFVPCTQLNSRHEAFILPFISWRLIRYGGDDRFGTVFILCDEEKYKNEAWSTLCLLFLAISANYCAVGRGPYVELFNDGGGGDHVSEPDFIDSKTYVRAKSTTIDRFFSMRYCPRHYSRCP